MNDKQDKKNGGGQAVAIPKQKTFTVRKDFTDSVEQSAEELDKKVSDWLRQRAVEKKNPPMFGKYYADSENLYSAFFYIDMEEVTK